MMDAHRKAAILLLSLDKPLAAEGNEPVAARQVERLTMEIARVDDVSVTSTKQCP